MRELSAIKVMPITESLVYIHDNQSSVVRFGDGEIDLMTGHSIPYQDYDSNLARELLNILLTPSRPELLVCLPDVFERRNRYNNNAQVFWEGHFEKYGNFYLRNCQSPFYGSTFLSRPYIDLADKSQSAASFEAIKNLWKGQDILIVEGETSRSGVGNDLFAQAKSVRRVICPSRNAYQHYQLILQTILEYVDNRLVFLMLGPTAKVLVAALQERGHRAIDLGHIDSEYEWFKRQATSKVKLSHKHTAEFNYDEDVTLLPDQNYQNEVLAQITADGEVRRSKSPSEEPTVQMSMSDLISVIVPVYNVLPYLERCLTSLAKQSYSHFEVLLINDGSTDGSGKFCETFSAQDSRFITYHQENQGVSAARNKALDKAKGQYITFIDSDDFVEETYLENLYQAAVSSGSDIAATNFTSFNEERASFLFYHNQDNYFEKVYSVQEWLDQEGNWQNNLHLAFTFSPLKLFKRHLFEKVRYPVGRLREDDATIYKLYLRANQIHFTNSGPYYYSQRSDGLSRTGMLVDIATMVSNAEERLALLASLGYDLTASIKSYVARLEKCQTDALQAGQIDLYQSLSDKLDLYRNFSK